MPLSHDGELARGRAAGQRFEWADAYRFLSLADESGALSAEDLELLAAAAYLLGHVDECRLALQRAHQMHIATSAVARAARCLFWVAFTLLLEGNLAPASGWLARTGRLLGTADPDCAEHGLLMLPVGLEADATGDHASAEATFARAAQIGASAGDADLRTLAMHFQGRALVALGRPREGVALLDEAMVAVVAGEVWPPVAGNIYCSMIDACLEMFDLRRAQEWTSALTAWWERQPDLATFTGQCLIHRAEILQLHGAWPEALDAARRARDQLVQAADRYATGAAFYREAELYRIRGELRAAEDAYREAVAWGHPGQPGLALLWLADAKLPAAEHAIRRLVAETIDRLGRARLLPAAVEILLAAGEVGEARQAAVELVGIADAYGAPALRAWADHSLGAVLLAEGDGRDALTVLRLAWDAWRRLDVRYEAAQVRVMIATGCSMVGDEESAALELDAVRRVFADLGAGPDLGRVEHLIQARTEPTEDRLSPRELQVLRLLATGKTNHAIAADLVIADKTVDRHVTNIFAKLGVSSRAAATAHAYDHHLL